MRRAALLVAVAGLCACIDKPLRPSERPDGAPGDHDAGRDASACDEPGDQRTAWDADDVVRFDQVTAQLNGDCFDDILVPGSNGDGSNGVFVILGRGAADFFVGGYDHFVSTTESEPLRVAATDLVGGPPPDLVVFARSSGGATPDEAQVRVFEGVGDGSFLGDDISLQIGASTIPSTGADEPSHYTLETLSAAAGGPVELLIGDSGSAFVIGPASWTQAGLDDAQVVEPFSETGTQGVVVAPSGRAGADDLVQIDSASWSWFFNTGALDYAPGSINAMLDSGQRQLRSPDARSSTEIASVSAQADHLSFLFFEPPSAPDATGAIVVKRFRDMTIPDADNRIDAVALIGLGGGDAPELLVLDAGAAGADAQLRLYHDVAEAGSTVDPSQDQDPIDAAPFDADHPYNRMALGSFRGPEDVKVYLFSSAPGVTPPICWLPDPGSGELSRCN